MTGALEYLLSLQSPSFIQGPDYYVHIPLISKSPKEKVYLIFINRDQKGRKQVPGSSFMKQKSQGNIIRTRNREQAREG